MHYLRPGSIAALAALSWWTLAAACSDTPPAQPTSSAAIVAATGAGGASPCNGFYPDGFCNAFGPQKESCACADCTEAAICTGKCKDDKKCDNMGDGHTEDCTCADCFFKADNCAPDVGCNNMDKVCTFDEACICKDCTDTEFCKMHCTDDGVCTSFFEGCACADCKKEKECTVTTTTSTSASSSTAASSSSSSSASASSSSSSGAGGAGGGK